MAENSMFPDVFWENQDVFTVHLKDLQMMLLSDPAADTIAAVTAFPRIVIICRSNSDAQSGLRHVKACVGMCRSG